jgi:CheY-like chemotaxis protein
MINTKILLAEKDVVVATDLAFELEALGLTISSITSSVESLWQLIGTKKVDFAILNVNLQDGVSYPAAKRLKALGIPFIFLTSFEKSEIDPEFHDIPRLSKPQDSRAIAEFVADLVRILTQALGADPKEIEETVAIKD